MDAPSLSAAGRGKQNARRESEYSYFSKEVWKANVQQYGGEKAEVGRVREETGRIEKIIEETGRRKKIKMCGKVEEKRNTLFFQCFVAQWAEK